MQAILRTAERDTSAALRRAIPMLTTHRFIQLDPQAFRLCKPIRLCDRQDEPPTPRVTWKPEGSTFLTLIKTADDTLVYFHANDTLYYTPPEFKLDSRCPAHTAFLAQWFEETTPDGQIEARVLVFDVVAEKIHHHHARGEHLRGLAHVLPLSTTPTCVMQWSGYQDALEKFVPTLPHRVECMLGLGNNPLQIKRIPHDQPMAV